MDNNNEKVTDTPKPNDATQIVLLVANSALEARINELASLARADSRSPDFSGNETIELPSGHLAAVQLTSNSEAVMSTVNSNPIDIILIDNREDPPQSGFANSVAGQILPGLLGSATPGRTLNRGSILVILPEFESTSYHAYAVGSLQLGGVLINPLSLADALESACKIASPPKPGKVALCLAGGGIEGMLYEMGALRAIDAHLRGHSVVDFDIFSGISSGAILGAYLANGVRPIEMADAMHGRPSRVTPLGRGALFDPNLAELANRAVGAAGDLLRGHWLRKPLQAAMKMTPSALFSGDKMKWHLEKELNQPGLTNDFNLLKDKYLFVGVTDQDTGAHVTFGTEGLRDIPISHALRASAAMTPYYPPEKIKGRYYIDGIFTRTINLDVAVAHGARLIICIDPLTPVQVDQPGYVSERGGFFNTVQIVKGFIRTRFSEVMGRAEEAYPNVAVCVFSPTRQDLEQMSLTMMRFIDRTKTEEMAFQSVSQRIQRDFEWMAADFSRHGFDLSRGTG